jgi:hypothetical protein
MIPVIYKPPLSNGFSPEENRSLQGVVVPGNTSLYPFVKDRRWGWGSQKYDY